MNRSGVWSVEVRGKGRGKHGCMVPLRFTCLTPWTMCENLRAHQDAGATAPFLRRAKSRPMARGQPLYENV